MCVGICFINFGNFLFTPVEDLVYALGQGLFSLICYCNTKFDISFMVAHIFFMFLFCVCVCVCGVEGWVEAEPKGLHTKKGSASQLYTQLSSFKNNSL